MAQESWNRDTSDGTGCQPPEGPSLCSNNCGFLGCSATMNLCSKCYRELVLKQGNHFPSLPSHVDKALTSENILPPSKEPFLRMDLALASPPSSTCSAPLLEDLDSSEPVMIPNVDAGPISTQISSKRDALSGFSSAKEGASSEAVTAAAASPTRLGALHTKRHTGNRCLTCQKRVGLLGFKCRCGDLFCATHRYSDKHSCSFDYKAAGREAIAKANPVVKAEKVVRL